VHQVVPVNYILIFITKKLNLIIIIIIRLWKARASEKLGIMRDRERVALQYNEKLKEKYGQHPLVSRIARHRQVPKHVKSAAAEIRSIKESSKRKEANRRRHSKPGSVPYVPERESHTIDEME